MLSTRRAERNYRLLEDKNTRIAVLLPSLNEEENIRNVIEELEKLGINGMDLIVLDASTDRTPKIVKDLGKKYGNITLMPRYDKDLGNAIKLGFRLALERNHDIIITMDADRSHKPLYIPLLLGQIKNGDVVIGSRYINGGKVEGWTLQRRLISRVANFMAKDILGLKTKDNTTNFRCYTRAVVESILPKLKFGGYACEVEIIYRVMKNGFRILEVPICFCEREKGQSKLLKKEYLRFIWTVINLRLRDF
jgi:dolichol-phosphate mannosyltransferase